MPLGRVHSRGMLAHAYDQYHLSRTFISCTGCHCTLRPNTEKGYTTKKDATGTEVRVNLSHGRREEMHTPLAGSTYFVARGKDWANRGTVRVFSAEIGVSHEDAIVSHAFSPFSSG
jgi:hypothetical protein